MYLVHREAVALFYLLDEGDGRARPRLVKEVSLNRITATGTRKRKDHAAFGLELRYDGSGLLFIQ
jgi:hypothetical protein